MSQKRRISGALCLLLAGLAACSSSNTPEPQTSAAVQQGGSSLSVTIINDHVTAVESVIFIEQVGGVRQSLGTVAVNSSPKFSFAATPGQAYVLVQQTTTGQSRQSDRFTFTVPTSVTWDLNTRRLTVQRR
jgi:hypothetical protein